MKLPKQLMDLLPGKKKQEIGDYVNFDFIADTGPEGGISFNDEKFIMTGTGYELCLYVSTYPSKVPGYWTAGFTMMQDTICTIDIASTDTAKIKSNLKKSMDEQNSRLGSAKSTADALDAQRKLDELAEMYQEVTGFGRVSKLVLARIYVAGRTKYEVDLMAKELTASLQGDGYYISPNINETKAAWKSALLSYKQQREDIFRKKGQEMTTKAVAGGRFFHFSHLDDPNGHYYGETSTGGSVFLDLAYIDKKENRTNYNFILAGKSGMGKSTLLKKMMVDRLMRGDSVRIIDPADEFTQLTKKVGGKIIDLDGKSGSIINMLQILPAEYDDGGKTVLPTITTYNRHIAKVSTIYRYLKRNVEENELLILKQVLRLLYIQEKIIDERCQFIKNLEEMDPKEFPTLSDLLYLVRFIIDHIDQFGDEIMKKGMIRKSMKTHLESIELKLNDLCTTYANLFDGKTTIRNFYDEDLVCFNTQALSKMEEEIYDAQLYNALSICWDNAIRQGAPQRDAWGRKELDEKNIKHTFIYVDEAHRTINARKIAGAKEIEAMMREGRKFFAGIGLSSQHLRDHVPDGAENDAVGQIRTMFAQTTYKFLMYHDAEVIPKLREVFQGTFTEEQIQEVTQLPAQTTIMSAGNKSLPFDIWAEPLVLEEGNGGM